MDIAQIRREYTKQKLSSRSVKADPIIQFELWLQEAVSANCLEPTGMNVSTVSENSSPASRMVLLKGVDKGQLIFYTNYQSRKAQHLAKNPSISALFYWPELERQVNIEGVVEKCSAEESDQYFQTRPWKSRIGAIISPQSKSIKNRSYIKKAFLMEAAKHLPDYVPRPQNWGGYRITPGRIEFWQGRSSRLHDRILFTKVPDGQWAIERLAP
jgi:pyridoxamine 5'-phosphate oxidase